MSREAIPAPKKGQGSLQPGSLTAGHNVPRQKQESIGVVKSAHLDGVGTVGNANVKGSK
jgi:hypothetical protein